MTNRKAQQQRKFTGAGHCVAAATFGVTVAVEEARKRGALHQRDCDSLTRVEVDAYIDLSYREHGINEWANEREVA